MNKVAKHIVFSFFVFCISFFAITQVSPQASANSIRAVNMDIYLDADGNASVTEVWNTSLSQGTEGYRPYTNLGNSSISNFSVTDDSGTTYESLSSWNTSAGFDSKAYKCGVHPISNGVELCWGISDYGNRTYTLKYDISSFVTQYTDTQGIYFNFLNLDQAVGNANITIHSDIPLSLENARIWAFGNDGRIDFENGNIVYSGGFLSSSQYMVALVRFESNLFNTANTSGRSFDDIYDSAFRDVTDSSYREKHSNSHLGPKVTILLLGSTLLSVVPALLVFALIWMLKKGGGIKSGYGGLNRESTKWNFGPDGKKLPSDSQIDYWREVPCDQDLERAYWVCSQYNIVSEQTLKKGIIGAILLKWIRNGDVTVVRTKKGLFSLKDNNYAIDFTHMTYTGEAIEGSLYHMLVSAAGTNQILEAKEFSKWSKKNYERVNSWFSSIDYAEQRHLEQQGLLTRTNEEIVGMFGRRKPITIWNVDPQLREDAIRIKGFKKFLLDFSVMPEREYFEVRIWEEYLIFAQLLGIADKVEQQFSKLYPDFNQMTQLDTDITTIAVRNMADICYEGVQAGIRAAARDYSGSSSFSGGGGSSFSGGGGSAGGSSGGGFR